MKRYQLLALFLTLCILFAGCGAKMENGAAAEDAYHRSELPEATMAGAVADSETGNTTKADLPINQKLIRTIWLDTETEDMDAMLSAVEEKVAQLEGYIENRSLQNGSMYSGRRSRYGSLTIRIPAENLDAFITNMSGISNIVSNRETTEDVTLSYVENESRVTALETEQSRLLELLAKAETMDDILLIENRLTEIRGELEKAKSTLRLYDNLVNYGTIHMDITEVVEYTIEEPDPVTFGQRLVGGLKNGWKALVNTMGELLVIFVTVLPFLAPFVIAGVLVLFIVKRKKKKNKNSTPPEENTP